jgi:hypothetical protein
MVACAEARTRLVACRSAYEGLLLDLNWPAVGWAERLGRQARSGKCTATGLAPVAFPQVSTGTPSGL